MGADADAHDRRGWDPRRVELAAHAAGRVDRTHPPRALGRERVPLRPEARADTARGADLRDLRRVRRARLEAPVQGRDVRNGGDRRNPARARPPPHRRRAPPRHFDPDLVDAFLALGDDLLAPPPAPAPADDITILPHDI